MPRRPRPRIGDIFTIPIDDDRVGVGQVVGTYGRDAYFLAVFGAAFGHGSVAVDGALREPVVLIGLSLDAKFHVGDWLVVDRRDVDPLVPLPAYKEMVGSSGRVDVVDFSGSRRRRATDAEAERLPNRTVVAPVRVERALRALHGLAPWRDAYDALRPDPTSTTAALFVAPAND